MSHGICAQSLISKRKTYPLICWNVLNFFFTVIGYYLFKTDIYFVFPGIFTLFFTAFKIFEWETELQKEKKSPKMSSR